MIEVLKQMVEALEWCHGGEPIGTADAITAGKQLIAELESQAPVAWRIKVETKLRDGSVDVGYQLRNEPLSVYDEPLYTHPPQRTWLGLEGEEIRNLWEEATKPDRSTMTMVTSFARAIESKLKELNT
jgi:hypothetical protein